MTIPNITITNMTITNKTITNKTITDITITKMADTNIIVTNRTFTEMTITNMTTTITNMITNTRCIYTVNKQLCCPKTAKYVYFKNLAQFSQFFDNFLAEWGFPHH